MGEAIVTSKSLYRGFETRRALHRLIEGIKVSKTSFRAVLRVEHEEKEALDLAKMITRCTVTTLVSVFVVSTCVLLL